jgi:hypothetical protein
MIGFVAQRWVQEALGVPLNYTEVIESVNQVFSQVGDYARGGSVADLGFILDAGTKVALMYGDRDYVSVQSEFAAPPLIGSGLYLASWGRHESFNSIPRPTEL